MAYVRILPLSLLICVSVSLLTRVDAGNLVFESLIESGNVVEDLSTLVKKVEALEQRLEKSIIDGTTKVETSYKDKLRGTNRFGFTASLTRDLTSLSPQQAVPFDKVTSNLGNTYDALTGLYTCALTGNYFFSATVTAAHQGSILASIVVDGAPVASVYAKDMGVSMSDTPAQGSNSAVAHCNIGQQVSLRVVSGNGIHGDATLPLSSFTGFLIWDD